MRQDDEYSVTAKLTLCGAALPLCPAPPRPTGHDASAPVSVCFRTTLLSSPLPPGKTSEATSLPPVLVILGLPLSSSSASEPRIHSVIHPRAALCRETTEWIPGSGPWDDDGGGVS